MISPDFLESNLVKKLKQFEDFLWINPKYNPSKYDIDSLSFSDMLDAELRLKRFAPFFNSVFPDTKSRKGIIESDLVKINNFSSQYYRNQLEGSLLLKCDHDLPVAGSIKARGGIYEVIHFAESLAIEAGLLLINNDYSILEEDRFRIFFSQFTIIVGSTGNLGLSIGIISSKMGFNVTVHMSSDAKDWKKELLKEHDVKVVEHNSDYSLAVAKGREEAKKNSKNYFIDDENSTNLFLGYSVAALRLKKQLEIQNILVDSDHPLFVYIPCGVGGGPGGVSYGLKQVFKNNVHCFFAEPTHSPCMLLGMASGLHNQISVHDIGIDNKTEADGLAVGRPSKFVGKAMSNLLSGISTVDDTALFKALSMMTDTESMKLEPSAIAGATTISHLLTEKYFKLFSSDQRLNSTHIIWSTGGSLVPESIMTEYYYRGK